ncbi:MAG: carbamoyltransferase HypF [Bacteroidales bacterium]|nr:carbamoyltransferase HypF [Bacteroidales bacterium]
MNTKSQQQLLLKQLGKKKHVNFVRLHINGLVQGVGFRPFIYRLAAKHKVSGWVKNTNNGVHIEVSGENKKMICFLSEIYQSAPPVADIHEIKIFEAFRKARTIITDFRIINSSDTIHTITEISPDLAVCDACLHDMENQGHRIHYPLINCTNCGPRFSIVKQLPYDRKNTTMECFQMCSLCAMEYNDIFDRRFHAQPVACNQCGPQYSLISDDGSSTKMNNIPAVAAKLIDEGSILALKGTGGFHLVCDAMNAGSITKLRTRKNRQGKPFAVMFASLENLRKYAIITNEELKHLNSWKRPVVLLRTKRSLPVEVNAGLSTIGAILPYMPFHHLLFRHLSAKAIVFTSGNMSDEPVVTDRLMASKSLGKVYDFLVDYNRDIHNRCDDSVMQIIDSNQQIIRRSRGFVPKPIRTSLEVDGVFATGGELKNCFCIGKDRMAIMSQHIGDLKNLETFSFYEETVDRFRNIFRFEPSLMATDMHPDYLTGEWSKQHGLKVEHVQHHHAHLASCIAEHRLDQNELVLGLCFDGTGYGTDGHLWGSEIMLCNLHQFERLSHFEYLPMPGADKAIEEPWRMALGTLYKVYGNNIPTAALQLFDSINKEQNDMVRTALEKNINISLTCGMGRLFDTVSSLLGVCSYANFEAEAPMKLEDIVSPHTRSFYETCLNQDNTILVAPIIEGVLKDLEKNKSRGLIAARFHNSIIEIAARVVSMFAEMYDLKRVVLSGGAFQNRYLLSGITKKLQTMNFEVFTNHHVPVNDGGIALGQLAVASARRKRSCV